MLCGDLEGLDVGVGGRFKREGIYVYTWLIWAPQIWVVQLVKNPPAMQEIPV